MLSFFFCDFILGRSSRGVNDENLSTTFPNGAAITFGMAVKLKLSQRLPNGEWPAKKKNEKNKGYPIFI